MYSLQTFKPSNLQTDEQPVHLSTFNISIADDTAMSQEPEQIGELIYQPNPDYPDPVPVERPPHYWMTEQTGRLAEAVEAYVSGEPIAPAALDLIRQYLRQYLERAIMTGDANRNLLLGKLATLRSSREIERFADDLAEIGVEPF